MKNSNLANTVIFFQKYYVHIINADVCPEQLLLFLFCS
jgi:hypothetical protein